MTSRSLSWVVVFCACSVAVSLCAQEPAAQGRLGDTLEQLTKCYGEPLANAPHRNVRDAIVYSFNSKTLTVTAAMLAGKCGELTYTRKDGVRFTDAEAQELLSVSAAFDQPNWQRLTLGDPSNPKWMVRGEVNGERVLLMALMPQATLIVSDLNVMKIDEALAQASAEKERLAEEAAAKAALYRTWTDNTGKNTVFAKFLEFKNGKVRLIRKADGVTIEVPTARLSKEDQQWYKEELKKRIANKKD